MWSKPLLCRFRQPGEIQQTQALQGFPAFRLAPSRIPPRHSQTRRDTNFATSGYSISAMIPRRREKTRIFCLWSFYISPILPCRAEKSNRKRAIFCPLSAAFLYRSLTVSPAGPAAALHLLGTDLRRWTAGTCRPSDAQGFARWKAPARCPLCGGRRPRAQSAPSARRGRCSTLPVTHS